MRPLILILLFLLGNQLEAQVIDDMEVSDTDTTRLDKIRATSEKAWGERIGDENIQYLIENVQIYHDSTFMYCDSAIIRQQRLKAISNVVVLQSDSMKIFADTMYYDGDSLKSELKINVVLQKGENSMYSNHLFYNMDTKVATYYDTASFFLKRTKLKSVKGIYDTEIDKATFIEKVNMIDSSFHLRTDTLDFYTKQEKMIFRAPTRIDQGTKQIYCEAGYYDIRNEVLSLKQNAQFQDLNTIATADHILYYSDKDEIQLIGNAYFKDNDQEATADKIIYNKINKTFDLTGNAIYQNGDKKIVGEIIHYDESTKSMKTVGRSVIDEKDSHLEADNIDFDEVNGIGTAIGNVIYKDTKANTNIYCEHMDMSDNKNKIKMYTPGKKTLLESIQDQDTMFLTADTLFTVTQTDSLGEETKRISAYNHVMIYKSDLQAVSDSMTYDTKEEIISLFNNPIMWSDTSQFTGDTIHLRFKEKKIHKVTLFPKAFISQSVDEVYFSQISGKKIIITFNDTTISRMNVLGNAESVYYMLDDSKKYIGVSKTICTNMQFDFNNGELSRSKFAPKPDTQVLPMATTNHEEIKLKAFSWQKERRPYSLEDILLMQPIESIINQAEETTIEQPIEDTIEKPNNEKVKKTSKRESFIGQ